MGVKSIQITLNATTATPLIVKSDGSGTTFTNAHGAIGDELPALITNTDATIKIYLGGPGVTALTGTPLAAGAALPINFLGSDGQALEAIAASGAPVVAVLVGRQ